MTNRPAPYRNPEIIEMIVNWWEDCYPNNRAESVDVNDLYVSYVTHTEMEVLSSYFIDRNQFAKCLVAAKIANYDNRWAKLPTWNPKEYELRRAKAA